jgi:hypothetical protein
MSVNLKTSLCNWNLTASAIITSTTGRQSKQTEAFPVQAADLILPNSHGVIGLRVGIQRRIPRPWLTVHSEGRGGHGGVTVMIITMMIDDSTPRPQAESEPIVTR